MRWVVVDGAILVVVVGGFQFLVDVGGCLVVVLVDVGGCLVVIELGNGMAAVVCDVPQLLGCSGFHNVECISGESICSLGLCIFCH